MSDQRSIRKKNLLVLLLFIFLSATGFPQKLNKPRLVVVIVVDGLGQNFLLDNMDLMSSGGFRLLMDKGAWFPDAHFDHATTFTAVGHATVLTGAPPNRHGLVGNDWLNRDSRDLVYCVEDPDHKLLGESTREHAGTSPRNLRVTTLGDELRLSNGRASKVLSISIKDRGAILPGGRSGTAFFYSSRTGRFITSTYYMSEYPKWWRQYYSRRPQDAWQDRKWTLIQQPSSYDRTSGTGHDYFVDAQGLGKSFPHPLGGRGDNPERYYGRLASSPFGNDYTLEFTQAAVEGELLGRNPQLVPDILAVSLSPQDYANHNYGPESMEGLDAFLRLDLSLERFFKFLDAWVGLENTLVALTADHGCGNSPEYLKSMGLEAGRVDLRAVTKDLLSELTSRFGQERLVHSFFSPTYYLDWERISNAGLSVRAVESVSKSFLLQQPGIAAVYTRDFLERGLVQPTEMDRKVIRSWDPVRSGDIFVVQKSGWYLLGGAPLAATHGSPWVYDTNVPLIFLGPWVRPGRYPDKASVEDLAATLAFILNIRQPSACEGRVLGEILR